MNDLIDGARQQLGWYVRNCILSPAAGMLEGVLRDVVNYLRGAPDDEQNDADATTASKRRNLKQNLRRVLRPYVNPGKSSDSLEQNALFAREEFGLDEIDTAILLAALFAGLPCIQPERHPRPLKWPRAHGAAAGHERSQKTLSVALQCAPYRVASPGISVYQMAL